MLLRVFFKVSCPACQLTLPFLERLKSVVNIQGISQDGEDVTREFTEYFGITFPVSIDSAADGYPLSSACRLTNVPSMFLVEGDGHVSWKLVGFDKSALEALAGRFEMQMFTAADTVPAMKPG